MGGTAAGSEHFARNLRELKDRSGLSYGQLARRLHVSTSTLHRYCNGDAVPADYAVVERLARLCGAGPEELVELHRRWVLADAVRRVGNRGGGGTGAERGGQGDDEEVGDDGDVGSEGELGGEGEGGADGGDGAAPAGDDPAGPAPSPEAAAEAAAPVTPAELEPIGTVPPPRRPRSWRRRLSRPAVAGSVAALVLTGAVLAMTGGEGAPARASSSSPSPRPGGADGTTPSPGRTGTVPVSPAASPSGRAPSTRPPVKDTKGVPRSPSGGTASRAPVPAQPLVWSVRSHVWENGCGHHYLIDRSPADVPPPPVSQDARAWATALGAVHGATTIVETTIRGRGSAPVVVQALHIRVVERRDPPRWSSYSMDNGCGGALTPAEYAVDLDAARPQPRPRDGNDSEHTLPVVRLPYQVSAQDPLVLRVHARTVRCDCDWFLELEWSAGGRSGTVRVDDGGRPFRTSGVKGRPEYEYWSPAGWTPN
ncbi:helix-turn-helix domain-containing protein [Actinacidiphila glaucinigra]|uniref:helix-turn-helix domain-containing protein n=1 Tax=Actinacidiphila glaucinigra TaxID=235986 RepID=UPI0035DB20AE